MKNIAFWGAFLLAGAVLTLSVLAPAQNAAAPGAPAPQNPRIALVIGEETYPDKTLATSANDAGLVAQVLQAAGFDVVGARDLDEKSIRTALRDFLTRADAAGPNMQAFVYLAGRAVQYEGDNFFVPVDAQLAHGADVPIEAVRLTDFTHALASAPGVARIVVVDGARANPYAWGGLPLAGGLALVEPETGELVAFNASPGSIAADEAGPYGIYAKTLAGTMRQGGVAIEDVFAQTRLAVNQASGGAQLPWSASKLEAPYFVFERAADAPPPAAPAALAELSSRPIKSFSRDDAYAAAVQRDTLPGYQEFLAAYPDSAQARRVRAILAGRREALFWRRSLEHESPHAYWTYLKRYPRGPHAAEAYERLHRLAARAEPPADFRPEDYSDLPPPPSDELVYADRPAYSFSGPDYGPPPPRSRYRLEEDDDDWRDLPPPPPPTISGALPALAVAIPLLLTARAYHDAGRRDGHAERGAPPPRIAPAAPPPLPPGVHVVQTPPGAKIQRTPAIPAPATATPVPLEKAPQPTLSPTPSATPKPTPTTEGAPAPVAKTPQPTPSPTPSATPKPTPTTEGVPAPRAKTPQPTPLPSPSATPKPTPTTEGAPAPMAKTPQPTHLPTPTPAPGATSGPASRSQTPEPAPLPTPIPHGKPKQAPERESAPAPLTNTPQPTPSPTPTHSAAPKPTPRSEAAPAPLAKTPQPTPSPTPTTRAEPKPTPKSEAAPAPLAKTPQAAPSPTPTARAAPKPTPKSEAAPAPLAKTPQAAPTPNLAPKPTPKSEGAPAPLAKTPQTAPSSSEPAPNKGAARPEKADCGKPPLPACPK